MLAIKCFKDQNRLETWSLEQLAAKCSKTQKLTIKDLEQTTHDFRMQLLAFVSQIGNSSQMLKTLHLENTQATAE